MTQTLSRPEVSPQPKGPDHRVERKSGKFDHIMEKVGRVGLRLIGKEGTPKQERRVGKVTSAVAGVLLLATAGSAGAAAMGPREGVVQEQVQPGSDEGSGIDTGVDTGTDSGTDNGQEQTPDAIPSLEQTPEQLAAPFIIPADTKPEDFPSVLAERLEMLRNAGANPVDMPVQNWDPNDPYLEQLATVTTNAGNGAIFAEGEPVPVDEFHVSNLYYYGKTSFEENIYPETVPYKISVESVDFTVVDNKDGTFTYTQTIRTRDNATQNSVQNQRKEQGDSNGVYDSTSVLTYTTKSNGTSIEVYDFKQVTTIPDEK